MRIISGKYKNKLILGHDVLGTRPTMSKIREALMSLILEYLNDSVFLDLFAGSGIIAFEALSNGAKKIILNDMNYKCIKNIKVNKANLNLNDDECVIEYKFYDKFLQKSKEKVDIIYLDPPYLKISFREIIDNIKKSNILKDNTIIIIETTKKENFDDLEEIKAKKYGDKYIFIYKIKR